MLGSCARQRTLARATRENDEQDVNCRNALEHIHHALVANNDVECMLARAEDSHNRKLAELFCRRGRSWSALWSRPPADDEMPCEALKCRRATGKRRSQLTGGRIEVASRTETLDEGSGQKMIMDTARKVLASRGIGH